MMFGRGALPDANAQDRLSVGNSQMPQYKCHKIVWALKILEVQPADETEMGVGFTRLVVEEPFSPITVQDEWVIKHNPAAGGYYVQYEDGYTSFSPAEAFENGYTPLGDAIEMVPKVVHNRALDTIATLEMRIADLSAELETATSGALDGAVLPAETLVHIAGFPFRLLTDARVEGTQAHVNEVLAEQARTIP